MSFTITSVAIDDKTTTALTKGNTLTLSATVDDVATDKTVVWSSSDDSVASVENGVVTANKSGTATITVTATNGTEDTSDDKTDTITITVTNPATGISLNKSTLTLTVGNDETLTANVTPTDADGSVTWSSSDTNVATVDSNGKVTAVAAGTATITATAGNKSATCTVTVKKTLTLTGWYTSYDTGDMVDFSLDIQYTDSDTWKDIAERYDEVSLVYNPYGLEEEKIVKLYESDGAFGAELKSNESPYNYKLVSINDKVSAYSSYYTR